MLKITVFITLFPSLLIKTFHSILRIILLNVFVTKLILWFHDEGFVKVWFTESLKLSVKVFVSRHVFGFSPVNDDGFQKYLRKNNNLITGLVMDSSVIVHEWFHEKDGTN